MTASLTPDEVQLVSYLAAHGLPELLAQVYATILCRQYRATKAELIQVLEYNRPESAEALAGAIDDLLQRGLLTSVAGLREVSIEARDPWAAAISEAVLAGGAVAPEIAELVDDSLKSFVHLSRRERHLIERLGWATWEEPRRRYRDAIARASHSVRMAVYSSKTVFEEVQDVIAAGWVENEQLSVQILMCSPQLAVRIESNPNLARDVETRTEDWRMLFAGSLAEARARGHRPSLEIRWLEEEELAGFHRGLIVDDHLWMMNVYRPGLDRGIEGIVYEGYCQEKNSNLYNMLDFYWRSAWERSVNPHATWPERLGRLAGTHKHLAIALLPAAAAGAFWALRLNDGMNLMLGATLAKVLDDVPALTEDLGHLMQRVGLRLRWLARAWNRGEHRNKG